jgi:hypothetical protein
LSIIFVSVWDRRVAPPSSIAPTDAAGRGAPVDQWVPGRLSGCGLQLRGRICNMNRACIMKIGDRPVLAGAPPGDSAPVQALGRVLAER